MSTSLVMDETPVQCITPARWTRTIKRSGLEDAMLMSNRPGIITFALGLPAPDLFPTDAYAEATRSVFSQDPVALQYGPPSQKLKSQIVELMAQRGVNCNEKQIFLTTGGQQGMNMLTRLLLHQGGEVLVEESVYSGLKQVIAPYEPEILTVPTDLETGMDVDAVETLLSGGARPAFIYSVTDGHNPFGISMSLEKRARLVKLARRYRIPIMEDDPYGLLSYDNAQLPPLRAIDDQWVIYIGSFSKILAPAMRVGWIVLPEALIPKLSSIKESYDINTATLPQRAISVYLATNDFSKHLEKLRSEYSTRRNTMLRSLERHFSTLAHWSNPKSGFFIWVDLLNKFDTTKLLKVAVETENVAFVPGHAFCADSNCDGNCHASSAMRLSFPNSLPEVIEEGIARLARIVMKIDN